MGPHLTALRQGVAALLMLALPAGAGAELINNPGFENGVLAPWSAWGAAGAQAGAGRAGSVAASIAAGSGAGLTLPATGGSTYRYTGWGRAPGQQGSATLFIKFFDSNWNQAGEQQGTSGFGTGWQQKELVVTAPASAAWVQVATWNSSNQSLYLDDMSLTEQGAGGGGSGQGGQSVSLNDPGFESGNTGSWQGWSTFYAAASNARSGTYAAHVPSNNGGGQFIAVTQPGEYVFRGWGRTSGGGWAGLIVKGFDAQWNEIASQQVSPGFTSGWSEQQVAITLPAGTARLQVSTWNASSGMLYLDDLSLVRTGNGGESGGGSGGESSGGGSSGGGITRTEASVTGTRYYVATYGSGVSSRRDQPGAVNATIGRVCDGSSGAIRGGDAIVFMDGEYRTSQFRLGFSPDSNQPGHGGQAIAMVNRRCGGPEYIHLMAENRHGAVIRNDVSWTNHSGGFDIRNSSYIWIEGFRIEGIYEYGVGFESGVSVGYGSDHAVIRHNRVNYVGGGGIVINRATHVRVENNEVTGAAGWHPYCASGISYFEPDNPRGFGNDGNGYSNYIVGNKVVGTRTRANCDSDADPSNGVASWDGNCIVLDQFAYHRYTQRTLIEGNLCVDNGGGGVHLYNSGHTDILNNTVYASGRVSVEGALSLSCTNTSVPSTEVRFANNLVHTWNGTALTATDFGLGCLGAVEYRHNVFVNRNPQANNIRGTTVNLTSDPSRLQDCSSSWNLQSVSTAQAGWVAPGTGAQAGGFGLTGGSVARNAASCSIPPRYATDHFGAQRQRGGRADIGAFEYPE